MRQFFASSSQSIEAPSSASVLPMTIQDWFPLELIGLIALQSKGLSRVLSNTTVQKHQFFGAQLSLGPTLCDPINFSILGFPVLHCIPRVWSNTCPLSQWCYPNISCSVISFSSCLQSFPVSGPFPMCWLSVSGGQSIGVSASASVLPMTIQDWFPLGWTGWTSLQSKGLSRVFSNTNSILKYQFFSTQLSL